MQPRRIRRSLSWERIKAHPLVPFLRAPRAVQAHVALRWLLCPFPALLPFVPASGSAVDVGCGHGIFPFLLSSERPGLNVLGIDADQERVRVARMLARERHNLAFAQGSAPNIDVPECDLLCCIDVMYLLPEEAQEALLVRALGRLRPGGTLLLKEMGGGPAWKQRWNEAQEHLAVRALRLTYSETRRFHFRSAASWQDLLERLGLAVRLVPLHRGYPHPHLLMVGRR